MTKTTVVILAAGESTRLGRPKQFVKTAGKSLIRSICENALASTASNVVVVIGGFNKEVTEELADLPIETILNKSWKSGLASSVKVGVNAAFGDSQCKNVILSVVDQPYLSTIHLNQLIIKGDDGHELVGSRYANGVVGVPVLLGRKYYPAILDLEGDVGARKILECHGTDLPFIDFPQGDFDVDRPEDLDNLPT